MSEKNENKIDNLFYTPKDGWLFFIAGYTDANLLVTELIKKLEKYSNMLLDLCPDAKIEDIKTQFISDPSHRYNRMRFFFLKTSVPPKNATTIDNEHTMFTFLRI